MSPELGFALTLMWQGMAGIFVVMIAIALLVLFLTKVTGKEQKQAEKG